MNQDSRVSYANQNAPKASLSNRDEQVNFLEEMRSLVNTVKALVGPQQTSTAPPPIAFAGYQAQQFLPHQVVPSHLTTAAPCYGVRKKSEPKRLPNSERPKRIRRGRKARTHKQSNIRTINFYYVNLNGYRSKKESLKQITEENNIHILLLTETKVYSKTAVKLSGFQVFSVVRTKRYGSGLQ